MPTSGGKKILISLGIIGIAGAMAIGATMSFFSDTETSAGNIFVAGDLDLKVDHTFASYNGGECVSDCVETGNDLVVNGGFETPDVPAGGWAIYPDASLTSWTIESGSGLEIQDHAAGNPHTGNQLAELDSYSSSAISQAITTVAGGKYRLTFWHSPRPGVAAPDNTIAATVQVVSYNSVLVNDTIGAGASGGSNTSWTSYSYDFVAVDTATRVMFSDMGTSNSYGGYLDDVSVKALSCSNTYPNGGTCTLWGEKDLGEGDTFWKFDDVKPGDHGINVISLHVDSNDAFACLITNNVDDRENDLIAPETAAGDLANVGLLNGYGELSQFIKAFAWNDANNNGIYELGEAQLLPPNTPVVDTELLQLSLTGGGPAQYIGLAWCAGTQSVVGNAISCDGSAMGNVAQTDSFTADVTAYAEQQRNNPDFDCANVVLP